MNEINSTDATQGQGLHARVQIRKRELETAMAKLPPGTERGDLERALGTIEGLLTGDLDNIPSVVSAQLSQWLETNKHLAEPSAPPPAAQPIQVIVPATGPVEAHEKVN